MRINWSAFATNPVYQVGGVVAALLLVGLFACGQESCKKKHVETAKVEDVEAEDAHDRLKDALQEIDGLHRRVAELEETGRAYKRAYEDAKRHIPPPPGPVPTSNPELAAGLEKAGFKPGVQVLHEAPASIFAESDAGLAWLSSQRAARADQLEEALRLCDQLQAQQAATLQAKDLELTTTNMALKTSMDEAMHRQKQADELGKALKVEQGKRWQKWAMAAGGFVVGVYAAKH